ncbi:MAG: DNA polymerase I [Campylobacteraceae bacterium]|nr:DNA polymerase I [Campylobacteraceae bacterium]
MLKNITVIDTFGFLFRSYYALPPLKSSTGFPTGMLTGFMNFVLNLGKDFQTDYIVFALDSKGPTFRNDIYDLYKANRSEVPEDLLVQLPVVIEWIEKMGFKTAARIGFEADDIIASIAHDAVKRGLQVRVVSHDKDLYQLIKDEEVFLFDPIKRVTVTEETCFEKYGVRADQFTDYQSLLGDSADNVPGVRGVGAKTAQALIEQFGSLDDIYANIEQIEKPRWIKLLTESKEMAYISKELVTLKTDCHVIDDLESFNLPAENPILKIENILVEFGLNNILNRVSSMGLNYKTNLPRSQATMSVVPEVKEKIKFEKILLNTDKTLFEVLAGIPKNSIIAFDTETTHLDTRKANIVGFSFCYDDKKAYYVPINHFYLGVLDQISEDSALKAIKLLNEHKLVLQNFKYDYDVIKHNFAYEINLYSDTMILAWMLDPGSKIGLDALSSKFYDHEMIAFKDTVKKGEDFSNVDINDACAYAAEDAFVTFKVYATLLRKFQTCSKLLAHSIKHEFYFPKVLSDMENEGIKLDVVFLETVKVKNTAHVKTLHDKICELAGKEFNLNSPKQLGEVLFEDLGLKATKKTKTGYSTNEGVLNKLLDAHEIVPKILEYREAFKLQSTYIEPLLLLAKENDDNRIHTSFLQTGTATGRLSSKNPNLQNIPVRSEAGKQIREAFIAKPGYKLIAIDYSQIELRLLAHFSQDKALLDAFNTGADVHTQTAIRIFGVEQAQEKRNIAKSINFGLIYGMGAKKLGETVGITTKEAKVYIESYFEAFSGVKPYLASIEDDVMANGFVETLLKRKRLFDFSTVGGMQKAAFLRESVNTVFQGSAADLIKLSMNKIHKKYSSNNEVKMLLQIHDELIFEIKDEIIDEIITDIKNIMINIHTLTVPLEVSVCIGNNWGELK